MANTYDVGDKVKVSVTPPDYIINPQGDENMYSGTVITYTEDDNGDYTYRLSVDGLGDTILAKESE